MSARSQRSILWIILGQASGREQRQCNIIEDNDTLEKYLFLTNYDERGNGEIQ